MAGPRWWRRAAATASAAVLGVAGAALVWTALTEPDRPPAAPSGRVEHAVASPAPHPTGRHPTTERHPTTGRPQGARTTGHPTPAGGDRGLADAITGPALPESRPVGVDIPRLHVSSALEELGLTEKGAMEVPRDPAQAGWFDRGPTPGALGPAVIAGHVTWNRVPAVFFRLATLRPGDAVRVRRADGTTAVFAVTRVARYGKRAFPTRAVYGSLDHAGLRLITCGGRYDAVRHRYLANVVVFADLVAGRPSVR